MKRTLRHGITLLLIAAFAFLALGSDDATTAAFVQAASNPPASSPRVYTYYFLNISDFQVTVYIDGRTLVLPRYTGMATIEVPRPVEWRYNSTGRVRIDSNVQPTYTSIDFY